MMPSSLAGSLLTLSFWQYKVHPHICKQWP